MNVLVPIANNNSVAPLVESGADEFYMGYIGDELALKKSALTKNRRSQNGNFDSLAKLEKAVQDIVQFGKKAFLTLNNHNYMLPELDELLKIANFFISKGGTAIIASDINLINLLQSNQIEVVLSTCAICTNVYDLQFWNHRGVNRFIFPRDMHLNEMKDFINKSPKSEFEAFIMNSRCKNMEFVCSSHHCFGGNFCKQLENSHREYFPINKTFSRSKIESADHLYYNVINKRYVCGYCSIWELNRVGVSSLKIVERTLPAEVIVKQVKTIKQCIEIAAVSNNKKEYVNTLKTIIPYLENCSNNLQCYYSW